MINLSKKIVAFDLDGTLAESKQHLEKDMSDLLCKLSKEMIVVVISGGSFDQFKKQFLPFFEPNKEEEDFIYKNLILLPTSGSRRYQYDTEKKEWIMTDEEAMSENERNKVINALEELVASHRYDIAPAVEGDEIIEDRATQITMSALGQHAPIDLKKMWDPNQIKRQQIKKELEEKLPEVNVTIGGATSIDVLPKGFNKAVGLKRLLDKLRMTIDDMIFVGDGVFPGGNDYSAYEAGIESIRVSGPEETKELIKKWII